MGTYYYDSSVAMNRLVSLQLFCFIREVYFLEFHSQSLSMRILYLALFGEQYTLAENIGYDLLVIAGVVLITVFITSLGVYKYLKLIVPAEALKEL